MGKEKEVNWGEIWNNGEKRGEMGQNGGKYMGGIGEKLGEIVGNWGEIGEKRGQTEKEEKPERNTENQGEMGTNRKNLERNEGVGKMGRNREKWEQAGLKPGEIGTDVEGRRETARKR